MRDSPIRDRRVRGRRAVDRRAASRLIALLVGVVAVACTGPAEREDGVDARDLQAAVARLAADIADQATDVGSRPLHIAVADFDSTRGRTQLGERVAHDLTGALAAEFRSRSDSTARVVTRRHLAGLVVEQDLFDRRASGTDGFVGADLLVEGLLTTTGDRVHASVQVLSVADGVVVGVARASFDQTADVVAALAAPGSDAFVARNDERASPGDTSGPHDTGPERPATPATADITTIAAELAPDALPVRAPILVEVDRASDPALCLPSLFERSRLFGETAFSRSRRLRPAAAAGSGSLDRSPVARTVADPVLVVSTAPRQLIVGPDGDVLAPLRLVARVGEETPWPESERRPTHVCLALDLSGSMERERRLDDAVIAVDEVLDVLGPRDWISIVGFNDRAFPVVKPVRATDQAKASIHERLSSVTAGGNTDFGAALREIAQCLRMTQGTGIAHHAVLVSDGTPTVGARQPSALGRLADVGGCLDTIGVGDDFGRESMAAIARAGHGEFLVVADGADLVETLVGQVRDAVRAAGPEASLTFSPAEVVASVEPGDGWEAVGDGAWFGDLPPLLPGAVVHREMVLTLAGPVEGRSVLVGELTLTWLDETDVIHTSTRDVRIDVVHAGPALSDA